MLYEQKPSNFNGCSTWHSPGATTITVLYIFNKGTASSKLISFADDTRVSSNIAQADDCDNLQSDLNSIYNWAV